MTRQNDMTGDMNARSAITPEALARMGDGRIAYVTPIRSEDSADGTPIMLTDSREAAVANAWSNSLETVSVH
jgi:hypothetical protein